MAIDTNATEFEIRADISPAVVAFSELKKLWEECINRMLGTSSASLPKIKEQFEGITASANTVTTAITKIEKAVKSQKSALSAFQSAFADAMTGGITSVKALAEAIGTQLVVAISSAATASIHLAIEFEKSLAQISTLLENEQLPLMGRIRDGVIDIFSSGVTSLKDLTGALYTTISYGITDPLQALEVVREAERGAIAGVSKVEVAASGIVTVMNAWGKEAYSTAKINDILFQTVKRAATNFPLLTANMGKVASVAAQTGISLEETMAAFSALTKSGLSTQMAFTYLKNLLVALLKPGKRATETFRELGIEFGDAAIKSKGLIGLMENIGSVTGGSAETMAQLFPNIRALQSAMTLAGKGLQNFRDDLGFMNNATGAAEAAYKRMIDTFWAQSKILGNTLQAVGIAIVEGIGTIFTGDIINIGKWARDNQQTIVNFAAGVGAVLKELYGLLRDLIIFVSPIIIEPLRIVGQFFTAIGAMVRRTQQQTKEQNKTLQQTPPIAEIAGNSIATSMQFAAKATQDTTAKTNELNSALQKVTQTQTEIKLGEQKTHFERVRSLRIAIENLKELKASGASYAELNKAVEQVHAAARMAGYGKRDLGYNVAEFDKSGRMLIKRATAGTDVISEYERKAAMETEQLRKDIAQNENTRAKERVSTGILTANAVIKQAITPEQKAYQTLLMTKEKLAGIKTTDPELYAKGIKAAQAIYAKSLRKGESPVRSLIKQLQGEIARDQGSPEAVLEEKYQQRFLIAKRNLEALRLLEEWYFLESEKIQRKKTAVEQQANKKAIGAGLGYFEKMTEGIYKEAEKMAKAQDAAQTRIDAVLAGLRRGKGKGTSEGREKWLEMVFMSDEEMKQKFGKDLDTLKISMNTFRETIRQGFAPDTLSQVAAWWGTFSGLGKKGAMEFVSVVQNTMQTFVSGTSQIWQDFWAAMITGPQDASKLIIPALLDLIGNMAASWAAYYAAMGIGLLATYQYGAAALAFAAAAALGIIAGISKGGAQVMRKGAESTGAKAATDTERARTAFESSQKGSEKGPSNINMYFGFLAPPTQRQAEYIAETMADALDRSRNKIGSVKVAG